MLHFASLEPDTTLHRTTRNIKRFKDGIDIIDLKTNASDAFKNTVAIRDGIKLGQSRKMYII